MDVILELQKFGLTNIEAEVYHELLKSPNSNGSQISKKIDTPRTSVYMALDRLYALGYVYLVPAENERKNYIAVEPENLMPKLKEDFIQTADFLKEELSKVQIKNNLEQTFNLKGEESIYDKVRELILKAKKEIYLNTNINLETFKDAIDEAIKNNVRIILFSFEKHVNYTLNIEVYNKTETPISNGNRRRIMLVVDMEDTLVANSKFSEFSGIYTRNELMVEIIAEHVHNDIYLTELEKTYEEGFWDKISLNTMKENKI